MRSNCRVLTGQKHKTFTLSLCNQRFFSKVFFACPSEKGEVVSVSLTISPESPIYLDLAFWETFMHFHLTQNCHLQSLSVLKSLQFVIWERVNTYKECPYHVFSKQVSTHFTKQKLLD